MYFYIMMLLLETGYNMDPIFFTLALLAGIIIIGLMIRHYSYKCCPNSNDLNTEYDYEKYIKDQEEINKERVK